MFSFIITDDICQYWKNLDEMILSSPYNADVVRCEWLISAQEGFIIALEFNDFDVSNLGIRFRYEICNNISFSVIESF